MYAIICNSNFLKQFDQFVTKYLIRMYFLTFAKAKYVSLALIVRFLLTFLGEKRRELFIENNFLLLIMYFFYYDIISSRPKYIAKSILKINYDSVHKAS